MTTAFAGKLEMTGCFRWDGNHVQDFEGRITPEPLCHTESHQLQSWLSKGAGDSWVMANPTSVLSFMRQTFYQPCLSLQETRYQPPWPFAWYGTKTPAWHPLAIFQG